MKTPEQILFDVPIKFAGERVKYYEEDVILAMKEHAKQWIVYAVALAGIDRAIEKNEATIEFLEKKIDAQ